MSRTILVTGGAGYIGSHTCKALALAGYEPVALDNLVYGHEWAVQWGPLVKADLADREAVARCFRDHRPEAVVHFAAYAYVGESVADPGKYYQNNVACTLNLLDAMRDAGCPRIVFSSSCAVYGLPEAMPMHEGLEPRPINPYGRTKLMVEKILADYGRAYGLEHVSLRYFNAAGADPDGELGEEHDPETHLIPLALKATLPGARPLTVFGTDWDTEDGTCVRDYIHVADLAQAHLAALELAGQSGTFNLGTGTGHSIRTILDAAQEVTGRAVAWNPGPRRPGDPPRLVADWTKAREILSWQPRYADIRTILEHAWNWMQGRAT